MWGLLATAIAGVAGPALPFKSKDRGGESIRVIAMCAFVQHLCVPGKLDHSHTYQVYRVVIICARVGGVGGKQGAESGANTTSWRDAGEHETGHGPRRLFPPSEFPLELSRQTLGTLATIHVPNLKGKGNPVATPTRATFRAKAVPRPPASHQTVLWDGRARHTLIPACPDSP